MFQKFAFFVVIMWLLWTVGNILYDLFWKKSKKSDDHEEAVFQFTNTTDDIVPQKVTLESVGLHSNVQDPETNLDDNNFRRNVDIPEEISQEEISRAEEIISSLSDNPENKFEVPIEMEGGLTSKEFKDILSDANLLAVHMYQGAEKHF